MEIKKGGKPCKSCAKLRKILREAYDFLEYCGWGDEWERSCANETKLPERIATILQGKVNAG